MALLLGHARESLSAATATEASTLVSFLDCDTTIVEAGPHYAFVFAMLSDDRAWLTTSCATDRAAHAGQTRLFARLAGGADQHRLATAIADTHESGRTLRS
jgi:hypothetical protein